MIRGWNDRHVSESRAEWLSVADAIAPRRNVFSRSENRPIRVLSSAHLLTLPARQRASRHGCLVSPECARPTMGRAAGDRQTGPWPGVMKRSRPFRRLSTPTPISDAPPWPRTAILRLDARNRIGPGNLSAAARLLWVWSGRTRHPLCGVMAMTPCLRNDSPPCNHSRESVVDRPCLPSPHCSGWWPGLVSSPFSWAAGPRSLRPPSARVPRLIHAISPSAMRAMPLTRVVFHTFATPRPAWMSLARSLVRGAPPTSVAHPGATVRASTTWSACAPTRRVMRTAWCSTAFPAGRVLGRFPFEFLPIGKPCWSPDRSDRVLFAGFNQGLYHYDFSEVERGRSRARARPQLVEWLTDPPGAGKFWIKDPCWPSIPARWARPRLAGLSRGSPAGGLDRSALVAETAPDGGAVVAAERRSCLARTTRAGLDSRSIFPAWGRRATGHRSWLTWPRTCAARVGTLGDAHRPRGFGRGPKVLASSGRRLARHCEPAVAPAFSSDGRWVYASCWEGSKLRVQRFAVGDDFPEDASPGVAMRSAFTKLSLTDRTNEL